MCVIGVGGRLCVSYESCLYYDDVLIYLYRLKLINCMMHIRNLILLVLTSSYLAIVPSSSSLYSDDRIIFHFIT